MQAFVLSEWKGAGIGVALLADDPVAQFRLLSERRGGEKKYKPQAESALTPDLKVNCKITHSCSPQVTKFAADKWRKLLQRHNWAQRSSHRCVATCYDLTSAPLESLCPWKREPEKSAVQGAFLYPFAPINWLPTPLDCSKLKPPPLGRFFALSREKLGPDERRAFFFWFCFLPALSAKITREPDHLHW